VLLERLDLLSHFWRSTDVGRHSHHIVRGSVAFALLADPSFLSRWRTLHSCCPHATAFQAPGFVRTWYETYQDVWEPVIVQSQNAWGDLNGLWLLAYQPATHVLVHAGAHQAEYHAWLALPGEDTAFLAGAWAELVRNLPFPKLSFKYLPATALAETLQTALGTGGKVIVRRHHRPLLRLDPGDIKASFAKKSNRSRINRLKKLGKVEFRRLTDPAELEKVFDELIDFYDFRQDAVHQCAPFRIDPRKRRFHSDLFSVAGDNETYVTVTLLDERPIAGFWGTASGKTVHVGMLIHSPFLAEHSPGKLHLMQLSEYLLQEGKELLDLTPGGAWKERFANADDEVAEAVLYASPWAHRWADTLERLLKWGRRCAGLGGLTPAKVQSALAAARMAAPSAMIRRMGEWASVQREFRVYRGDRSLAEQYRRDERVRCNSLADLLAFKPGESGRNREVFLSSALARLEQGESAYFVSQEGRVAHHGWMAPRSECHMPEVGQSMAFPPGSVSFYDFYSAPEFRGQGLCRAIIGHMLQAAFSDLATRYAYLSVPSGNPAFRHVIETMGFEYQGSFCLQRRFGVEKKWTNAMEQPD